MALFLNIEFATEKECREAGEKFHKALAGSSAYIDNDIILDIGLPPTLCLVVGSDNKDDIEIDIDSDNLTFRQ